MKSDNMKSDNMKSKKKGKQKKNVKINPNSNKFKFIFRKQFLKIFLYI